MKGYYIRCRTDAPVPSLQAVSQWLAADVVYACVHEDLRGGNLLEIASSHFPPGRPSFAAVEDYEVHPVHILDFWGEAIAEAGGVCVTRSDGEFAVTEHRAHPLAWRRQMGALTHVLDDVDLSHPLALHAAEYADLKFFLLP